MIIEGKIKCATCGNYQHVLINTDEGIGLDLNESILCEWKCSNCGFLNELEVKNTEKN